MSKGHNGYKGLYILAIVMFAAVVTVGILLGTDDAYLAGWFQAGATGALLFITWMYAKSAEQALDESKENRKLTRLSLEEAEASRMDALRPVLALENHWEDLVTGRDIKSPKTLRTYIRSIGPGPAMNIKIWSNYTGLSVSQSGPTESRRGGVLSQWAYSPMPVTDSLEPGAKNPILETPRRANYSILEDNCIVIFIEYTDIYSRHYVTVQGDSQQRIHGPFSKRDSELLFREYSDLAMNSI